MMETNDSRTEGRVRNIKKQSEPVVVDALKRNDKLKKFINDVVKTHLQFKRPEEEVTDIKTAIGEGVHKFSKYLHKFELDVSRIYPVGSIAENTRINEPDEFDFILGLLNYTEDVIEIKICEENPDEGTYPHLTVKDDKSCGIDIDYENKFYDIKAEIEEMKQCVIEKQSGTMMWEQFIPYHSGPAMTCVFEWTPKEGTSLKISVDIVLAIANNIAVSTIDTWKNVLS